MFEPFPGNYVWNLSTNIALNTGAALDEVLDAVEQITARDPDADATAAYLEAYEAVGDRLEGLAGDDLAAGDHLSAADKYERAAVYYLTGERTQRVGRGPRERVYDKMLRAFSAHLAHTDRLAERVEIPFGDTAFPGILLRPPATGGRSPVMVHLNGLDSTKEMIYGAPLCWDLARRGVATLMVDHPGTGEALRLRGLHAAVESESWVAACIDHVEGRDDLDPGRIGVVGWSLGGFYAPRAAAHEPRLALCACWGASYDWGGLQARRARREGENPVPHYWEHVQWVWGKDSFDDFMRYAPAITLDGVLPGIRVPFLVVHGSGDRQVPVSFAHAQHDGAVNSPDRELRVLTPRDGGVEHVGADNMRPASSIIADWVTRRL